MACNCVLVVEDESAIRDALEEIFLEEGFKVFTATNGQKALEILPDLDCPCILIDLMMPIMGGEEFLWRIRSEPIFLTIPVIVTSAAVTDPALQSSVNEFIRKPYDIFKIVEVIRGYLKHEGMDRDDVK